MLRASKDGPLTTREGTQRVLRELFDNERVYLKELPPRRTPIDHATAAPDRAAADALDRALGG